MWAIRLARVDRHEMPRVSRDRSDGLSRWKESMRVWIFVTAKRQERFSGVFSGRAHAVPAEFGRLASFNRKEFLGDTPERFSRVFR